MKASRAAICAGREGDGCVRLLRKRAKGAIGGRVPALGWFSKNFQSLSPLKKVKRKAATPRCPAQSERKSRVFSTKRQAVWFWKAKRFKLSMLYLMTSGYGKMYWMPMSSANVSRTWVMTLLRLPEKESRHSSKPRSIHATKNQPSARLASYGIGGSQPDILACSTKLA